MARAFVDGFHAGHRGHYPDWLIGTRTYAASERGWRRTLGEMADEPEPERCVLLAESDGEVAGVVMGGPPKPWPEDDQARAARPTGELYALYVDPRHWRRGAGRALLSAAAAWLAARGRRRLLVGALADNGPARRFYEAVGGRLLGHRPTEDEGVVFDEVVYVWEDGRPSRAPPPSPLPLGEG
jgi:ribosomal protein S18 acetylase RimI-like enzyme